MKTAPRLLVLTVLLTSCATQGLPQTTPTGPASGIAGLPILKDQNADSTSGVFFGIFRERDDHAAVANEVANDLRFKPATVMWYSSWKVGSNFPKADVLGLSKQGVVPNITWEPWDWTLPLNDPKQIKLQDILDGKFDDYIRSWAKAAKEVNVPFLLRWGHEFNGNWYPWAVSTNGQDPTVFVKAYQHVHDIFKAEGATKVQWIWCYNNADVPGDAWNDVARAYPGDAYVDWVGLDGYNWGTNPSWGSWAPFKDVFKGAYDRALKIAPGKPIIIGEFASSEVGGDKGQWILNMFSDLPRLFPQIKAIVWFDIQKEEDWRIDSSHNSFERLALGLRSKDIRGNGAALLKVPASIVPPLPPAGDSKKLATFETLAEVRLVTQEGGKVFLGGFQEQAAQPSTFSNQDQGNEPPAVVYPAGDGQTQHAGFDFGIKSPNAYAGVVMSLEVKPRNAEGKQVSVDYSSFKTLRVTLKATGTTKLRLEFIGDKSLGIQDGSYPQVYVDVSAATKTVDVPISSFAQPDWASVKKTTTEVLKQLITFNVVADTVPSSGNVQIDDLMLLP
ncbi:glycoside hydrolase family 26 protein [Deinococcus roseus]|nr:glycosyl hydrolase [Deinococcus roseus]